MKKVKENAVILKTVSAQNFKNVLKCVPIKSKNMAVRLFTIGPGGSTDYHKHANTHMNYVLAGTINVRVANGPDIIINSGDFFMVGPYEMHAYTNKSQLSAQFLCITEAAYEPDDQ